MGILEANNFASRTFSHPMIHLMLIPVVSPFASAHKFPSIFYRRGSTCCDDRNTPYSAMHACRTSGSRNRVGGSAAAGGGLPQLRFAVSRHWQKAINGDWRLYGSLVWSATGFLAEPSQASARQHVFGNKKGSRTAALFTSSRRLDPDQVSLRSFLIAASWATACASSTCACA